MSNIGLERVAKCHADGARLVGRESEPCAATPFPVEVEQRLLVGHVADVKGHRESALEIHSALEVDHVVLGQFEIDPLSPRSPVRRGKACCAVPDGRIEHRIHRGAGNGQPEVVCRLVADDLPRGHAADRHLALARSEILDDETGDIARQIFKRDRAGPPEKAQTPIAYPALMQNRRMMFIGLI